MIRQECLLKIEEYLLQNSFSFIFLLFLYSMFVLFFSSFSNWILFITFIGIFWYTLETVKLRKETRFSTELSNRPLITIDLDRIPELDIGGSSVAGLAVSPDSVDLIPLYHYIYKISVVNIGNGPALNIQIHFDKKLNIQHVEKFDVLKKDERKVLFEGKVTDDILQNSKDVKIEYHDMIKNSFFTICKWNGSVFNLKKWG